MIGTDYIFGSDKKIAEITTPWHLVTTIDTGHSDIYASEMRDDGRGFFILPIFSRVQKYTCNSFDYDNAAYSGESLANVANYITGMKIKSDGIKLFEASDQTKKIYQTNMATPWDMRSYSSWTGWNAPNFNGTMGFDFSDDGTILIVGGGTVAFRKYILSTPWDITTCGALQPAFYTPSQFVDGFQFYGNGMYYIEVGRNSGNVIYRKLGAAYNPSNIIQQIIHSSGLGNSLLDVSSTSDGEYVLYQRTNRAYIFKPNIIWT